MNNFIGKLLPKIKKPWVLIAVGIAGMILIGLSSCSAEKNSKEPLKSSVFSAEDYRQALESEICDAVNSITGKKDASVVVTLDTSVIYSYADTTKESSSGKTETDSECNENELSRGYVTVKTADGGEQALLLTEQMPEIRGVAIVCFGGDDELINQKIQNTVTAALNITKKRVYICGRNTQ